MYHKPFCRIYITYEYTLNDTHIDPKFDELIDFIHHIIVMWVSAANDSAHSERGRDGKALGQIKAKWEVQHYFAWLT